jgi:hypothetical protein
MTPCSSRDPLAVEDGHLASGPEAGVDGHHDLLGDRRLEQEAAQVAGEDVHGVAFGEVGQVAADLAFHARQEEPVEGVECRGPEGVSVGVSFQRELPERRLFQVGTQDLELDLEGAFLVAPIDREHAVGGDVRDRLGVGEVVAIFQALAFGDLGLGGHDPARLPDDATDRLAHGGYLADGLGQDVSDPFEDLLGGRRSFSGATSSAAAAFRSVRVSSRLQMRSASGSRPLSRASDALVFFFGLNGR